MTNRHPEFTVSEQKLKWELRRRSRRDFLIGGAAAVAAFSGYEWLMGGKEDNSLPVRERKVLNGNGNLGVKYVSDSHLMPTYSKADYSYLKANGDIGLDPAFKPGTWQLKVQMGLNGIPDLSLKMDDIKTLPPVTMITRFCCVEGWSAVAGWKGVRFSDFTKKYFPPARQLPRYVYMTTPDEDYYVGLDTPSAMHPQTLLAYELNDKPLTPEHGAPLRLVIPTKYGIKNIKRIGSIQYTDDRPTDYWYEQGYDWFAGL
ncbi:MAG TPA: molybdopterin-dependent oxidoreductase [Bryobacteraceae bacterium]|jgi:DMSO/TMAO reductase YedYZ molybdopterin-dependent catalytic subunit|nr:molybdopterin-dependent oxidoreductase [Bryobacteraceae bacterium]